MEAQVFLSHSNDDQATADDVCRRLEARGIRCWLAPRDVVPGADYGEQIIDAIEGTRATILILSDGANQSTFVKNEIERAIAKGKPVIPFRISNVQPSRALELFISRSQWIDAWAPPLEARVEILATAVQGLLSLPPLEPDRAAHPSLPATAPAWRRARTWLPLGVAVGAVAVLMVAGFAAWSALSPAPAPSAPAPSATNAGPITKTITLEATAWNGVPVAMVEAGDHVKITASGMWCMGFDINDTPVCGSPNGIYAPGADEPVLVQTAMFAVLVARVGEGDWFAVGSSFEWTVSSAGQLRIACNERTDGQIWWLDNAGSIAVQVTIDRSGD
jgi:hypothetical protein